MQQKGGLGGGVSALPLASVAQACLSAPWCPRSLHIPTRGPLGSRSSCPWTHCFSIKGQGTVMTGTILSGSVQPRCVEISPQGQSGLTSPSSGPLSSGPEGPATCAPAAGPTLPRLLCRSPPAAWPKPLASVLRSAPPAWSLAGGVLGEGGRTRGHLGQQHGP